MGFFDPSFQDINVTSKEGSVRARVRLSKFGWRFKEAQIYLDRQMMLDMQPYIPFRTGDLQRAITTKNNILAGSGKLVVYTLPYGRYVYLGVTNSGKQMQYTNPLTTPRYFDNVKRIYRSNWTRAVRDIIFGRK